MSSKILNIVNTKKYFILVDANGNQVGRPFTNISNAMYKSIKRDNDAWDEGNKECRTFIKTVDISKDEQDDRLLKALKDGPVDLSKKEKLVIARALADLKDRLQQSQESSDLWDGIYSVLEKLA